VPDHVVYEVRCAVRSVGGSASADIRETTSRAGMTHSPRWGSATKSAKKTILKNVLRLGVMVG